jgi:hypothetical protein
MNRLRVNIGPRLVLRFAVIIVLIAAGEVNQTCQQRPLSRAFTTGLARLLPISATIPT